MNPAYLICVSTASFSMSDRLLSPRLWSSSILQQQGAISDHKTKASVGDRLLSPRLVIQHPAASFSSSSSSSSSSSRSSRSSRQRKEVRCAVKSIPPPPAEPAHKSWGSDRAPCAHTPAVRMRPPCATRPHSLVVDVRPPQQLFKRDGACHLLCVRACVRACACERACVNVRVCV